MSAVLSLLSGAGRRDFERRYRFNRQIIKKLYWILPVDDVGHGSFIPVGRGVRSSTLCGSHRSFSVCFNVAGHKGKFLDGVDCTDKVVVRHNHLWCKKSSCPVCFINGWSVNRARSIADRLETGVNRGFGQVEHIMVSVPVADRGLSESVMRKKCRDALKDRGVIGGCMIFHGFRIDKKANVLRWGAHYHVLGFLDGGYGCRDCTKPSCVGCAGFERRTREFFKSDGCIVKVMAEREKSHYDDKPNVFGTAHYQLNHASVKVGLARFHAVTWFGNCAKRKFKSVKFNVVELSCPLCEHEMVKSMHVGERHIVKDVGSSAYVPVYADVPEDYVPVVGSRDG